MPCKIDAARTRVVCVNRQVERARQAVSFWILLPAMILKKQRISGWPIAAYKILALWYLLYQY